VWGETEFSALFYAEIIEMASKHLGRARRPSIREAGRRAIQRRTPVTPHFEMPDFQPGNFCWISIPGRPESGPPTCS
jgi:hypothetical protein